MGDLQATVEFLVELYKFYNVDLFIRGYYQFHLTFKPPKSSHAIQVEICEGHGERGAFTLFPAFVTNDGQTAVSRTFNIYYKDEEVLLKDVFLFRVHLLVDSTKAADCIDKTALEMTVDVHFTDQVVRESDYRSLPLVTSRTLKFHFSCFNGLHHQVPLLFDYYYFSVLDVIVHANVVSLGLPNWSILKQIKTGWFSKSTPTPRSSTPLFYGTLFGNRSQLGSQFYSDPTLRYAVTNSSSISREHFEKASAIHRNLCAILAMAHSQLLNYFDEMMQQYFDKKQRIKLGEKLDPADLVEGLCKKLETLQSCEQVFDEMCSDMSVLNNELALLWLQFQESFTLNDQIRPVLREQHHHERMTHFSEAFFVHELPWKSLLKATDSSFQKHLSMGQCMKSSRYLSMILAVAIECAEVDGDSSSTPIFFEDRYVNRKETNVENEHAVQIRRGSVEDDILEHKPLSFGILNKAFNDISPQVSDNAGSSDFDHDLDAKEVWVDIKAAEKNDVIVAREAHAKQDECIISQSDDKVLEGIDSLIRGYNAVFQGLGDKPNTEPLASSTSTNNETIKDKNILRKNDCQTETSQNTEPSALIDCKENSLENMIKNVETPQATNDNGDVQGSQEHCGTILGTKDSEVRDVSDITAIIDTTAEDQPSMPGAEFVSVIDPSSRSQESGQKTEETVASSEGTEGKDVSSGDNEGCLGLAVVQNETTGTKTTGEKDLIEPEISTCLTPNTNSGTTVENLEAIKNDSPLESASEKVDKVSIQGLHDREAQNKITIKDVSSNSIVAGSSVAKGKEADKKTSCVRYVGSSDTTAGNCSELERHSKNGSSIPETSSKVVRADKSTGNDSTIIRFPISPDETTTLLNLVEKTKTEDKTKGVECSHLSNSSSEQTLEKTSDTNITSSSNPPPNDSTNDNSGSKARNNAQISSTKRVSNSVFYEGLQITNSEENSGGQGSENKEVLDATDTIRLSSNSSADAISCFCGAGRFMKMSSPYRLTSEGEGSNSMLQKAKQDVISRMNYCGMLYSEFNTEFLVKPYFINPKPDLSMEPIHFVVCVHGLEGNSGDLRLLRCFLEMALPSTKFEFLMSEVNQDNTFVTFEKLTEKLVSEILHNMEAYRISPTRISFIGHSLGNIIIRSALNHPHMEPYVELFHTFLSLSGPHLGMAYHTSSLVSTGMWLLQKWKKSDSLLQLSLNDSTDMRDTFIYKLSKKRGLEFFTNVLLVSSVQDHYVPFHSSRIELPKSLRSNSQECIVYREMMENLLTPLLSQPDRTLVRYSVYHCLPSSTNTFIGRAAHIAMLDSELFIEKLICTSAAKYFQ